MNAAHEIHFHFPSGDVECNRLVEFAKSFDHPLFPPPVFTMENGHRQVFAFGHVTNKPLIFTAWHTDPAVCTHRSLVEAMKALKGWCRLQHGGAYAACSIGNKTFTPEVMEGLGLRRCNMELFRLEA